MEDKHWPQRRDLEGITCGTAVGAKQGRMKGNKQRAEYKNLERRYEKSDWKERGERKKRKRKTSTRKTAVRWNWEEVERKRQRLSSRNPKLKRTKECENSGGQKVERKRVKPWNGRPRTKVITKVSRVKQLQRLKPAEDERKLQIK